MPGLQGGRPLLTGAGKTGSRPDIKLKPCAGIAKGRSNPVDHGQIGEGTGMAG